VELEGFFGVESVAQGAIVHAERGGVRRIEQREAVPSENLRDGAPEVRPQARVARVGLQRGEDRR
jgi:hypothetical protein